MNDFVRFLWAVGGDWVGKMSGGLGLLFTIVGGLAAVLVPSVMTATVSAIIFIVLGIAGLVFAAFWAWLVEHNEREKAEARFRPKLEILSETGSSGQGYYITVKSLADVSVRFGVKIATISPEVPNLLLPVSLPIPGVPPRGELISLLPGRQEHRVFVFILYGPESQERANLINIDGGEDIPKQRYEIRIVAHGDAGADVPSVERKFIFEPRDTDADFLAAPESTPATPATTAL
jgi:hypothetical protein